MSERLQQVVQLLKEEREELQKQVDWLADQIETFNSAAFGAFDTAGSASRKPSIRECVLTYLDEHHRATPAEIAAAFRLNRRSTASTMSDMAKVGAILKADRGYARRNGAS